jgi:hypothetical protein
LEPVTARWTGWIWRLAGGSWNDPGAWTVEWYLKHYAGVVEQISRISKEGEIFS